MKRQILASCLFMGLFAQAQKWEPVGFTGGFVNTVDTFQNKLIIAGAGPVVAFDGTAWSNIGSGSIYSSRNINNLLYMGLKDFTTNGEGIVRVYDGNNIIEKQGYRQFQYNGNKKIVDFIKANNNIIYLSDGYYIFEWRDTSTYWNNILPSPNIKKMFEFNGKLVYTNGSELYFYDGNGIDSLGLSNYTLANGSMFGSVSNFAVKGTSLYLTGSFTKIIDLQNQQSESGNILKYDGTNKTIISANFASNPTPSTLAQLNCIFIDDNNDIYATAFKDPEVKDAYLIKYDGTTWSDIDKLVEAGKGSLPNIPGTELADYNLLFKYKNDLFIGGRFVTVGGDSIAGLARFKTNSTGVNEVVSQVLKCYPNPAQSAITLAGISSKLNIICYDAMGKEVLKLNNQSEQIDVSELPKGLYYLVATNENGQLFNGKFIKQE